MSQNPKTTSQVRQVGRFGLIGIVNTVIDFGIYNLLFNLVGLALIPANLISASVAMVFSFVANKSFVFRSKGKFSFKQAVTFLIISAIAVYGIQNLFIYVFAKAWPSGLGTVYGWFKPIIGGIFSREFVIDNGAKALGVATGMVWNFLLYKRFVFRR